MKLQMHRFEGTKQDVAARRWVNGDGRTGGWVANAAQVRKGATINYNAEVSGVSYVAAGVILYPGARVAGEAMVPCGAIIHGGAYITGREYAHGQLLEYTWDSWLDKKGVRFLRYGCECWELKEMTPGVVASLVRTYVVPGRRAVYREQLTRLVKFCRGLPGRSRA